MPTAFPPPLRISPLIKFFRWSLLISGIAYGIFKQNIYTRRRRSRLAKQETDREIRNVKLRKELEKELFFPVEHDEIEFEGKRIPFLAPPPSILDDHKLVNSKSDETEEKPNQGEQIIGSETEIPEELFEEGSITISADDKQPEDTAPNSRKEDN